jgi:plasmid replication initiation protein
MEKLRNRNFIHASPAIVNAKYSLTKSESDLVLMLLAQIDKSDIYLKRYEFTKKELEDQIRVKINSKQLYFTAKSLMGKVLSIWTNEEKWELYTWFSKFKYDNEIIEVGFHEDLYPYLLELKQYVIGDNRHLLEMKSDYSRRIYMLLKEFSKFGTRTFNVEELQEMLDVPNSFKIYSKFKQGILTKAKKEIDKYTDLEISFEEVKRGRKVVEVTFSIKQNKNDLKTFIGYIRELYVNELLYYSKDGRPLKCSADGLLYYADETMQTLDSKTANKAWEFLHEHRDNLECFKPNLFDYEKEDNQ